MKTIKGDALIKVLLVPIEVFGTDCVKCDDGVEHYGLCDSVGGESDCNRAEGKIYRKADPDENWGPFMDDVIAVYIHPSEIEKFERKYL